MKLISSREAVDFLSQAAPRPWVQRLLRWMAFDEGLIAYSRKGRVQAIGSVADITGELIEIAGEMSGIKMDAAIRDQFSPELAEKVVGKDPFSRFEDDPYIWDESEDPVQLDIGFFLYADEIDWEAGVLKADFIPSYGDMNEVFFPNSEFLGTQLERADFVAEIEGLSFEFTKIEMLLPSFELGQTIGFSAVHHERRRLVGRPPKWDWEGAMSHVISEAQRPDGLPTGPGAQAKIEGLISDWFVSETQDAPALSQVRKRAAKIIQMIETSKTN